MDHLKDLMEKIRAERIAQRSFPKTKEKDIDSLRDDNLRDDNLRDGNENIEKKLSELKNNEPSSDNVFKRLAIIGYEYGYVQRALSYAEIFGKDERQRKIQLANAKLEVADLITQINLLCLTMKWDFQELRKLGIQHLEERHEEFKKYGWSDLK